MATPSLTLYRSNGACTITTHAVLRYLNIPFTSHLMGLTPDGIGSVDGTLTNADFLAINPKGKVPTLVSDGTVITEMPAVLTYIANLKPEGKPLLGEGPLDQIYVMSWMAWLSGVFHGKGYDMKFAPERFVEGEEAVTSVREKGEQIIRNSYQFVDRHLQGRTYMVGEGLTLVDWYLIPFWHWGVRYNHPYNMREEYPNYAAAVKRIEGLEAMKATILDEGVKFTEV